MPHTPDSRRTISIKTKLALIVAMFILVNLIFYVAFDSSDESDESIELDDTPLIDLTENSKTKQAINTIIDP